MRANSITAPELGFSQEWGSREGDPSGIGLGVGRWTGSANMYGIFEISLEKLNVFNLKVENMRVTFGLSADGNAWAGGSVYVYYSDDEEDYDVYNVDSVSWTGIDQYHDRSTDITFRNQPVKKIGFHVNGWDSSVNAGTKAYVKSIILNPRGRTYLMYKGKAENKGIYGDWEVRNGEGGTASYENMYIRYQSNDTNAVAGAWIRTKGKLDITEYTTLNVEVYFGNHKHDNSSVNLKVLNSESTDEIVKQYERTDIQNAGYTMSLDLTDLTDGSYPIEISLDGYEDLRIYNIWVE